MTHRGIPSRSIATRTSPGAMKTAWRCCGSPPCDTPTSISTARQLLSQRCEQLPDRTGLLRGDPPHEVICQSRTENRPASCPYSPEGSQAEAAEESGGDGGGTNRGAELVGRLASHPRSFPVTRPDPFPDVRDVTPGQRHRRSSASRRTRQQAGQTGRRGGEPVIRTAAMPAGDLNQPGRHQDGGQHQPRHRGRLQIHPGQALVPAPAGSGQFRRARRAAGTCRSRP
jgi:hypothetical protein